MSGDSKPRKNTPPAVKPPSPLPLDGRLDLVSKWSAAWNWEDDEKRFARVAVGYGWVLVDDGEHLSLLDADTGEIVSQQEACKGPVGALMMMDERQVEEICGDSVRTRSLPDLYGTVTASLDPSPDQIALTNGLIAWSSTVVTNPRRSPHWRSKLAIAGDIDATFEWNDRIGSLVFSPDRQLLIVSRSESLTVLTVATGDWRELPRELRFMHALSLSPDNKRLFGFDREAGIRIVALDTYEVIHQYPRDVTRIADSMWLNNETVLAATHPGLLVFRLGDDIPEIHERPVRGYVLAASSRDRMVCLGGEGLDCWDVVPVSQ
jgi:hypothetical protein